VTLLASVRLNEKPATQQGVKGDSPSEECAICLSGVANATFQILPCGPHTFHTGCLNRWSEVCKQNGAKPSCPLCRAAICPKKGEDSDAKRGDELVSSAKTGDEMAALTLLLRGAPLSDHHRGEALYWAVENGHRRIAEDLAKPEYMTHSEMWRSRALISAAKRGNGGIVRRLVSARGSPISDESRGEALLLAIKGGHRFVAQDLTQPECITHSEMWRSQCLTAAREKGYASLVQRLFEQSSAIEQKGALGSAALQLISRLVMGALRCARSIYNN
jgi:hypothetical protein